MKNIKDIKKELLTNLITDYVKQRDGAKGKKLDYMEGWRVIDEMNRIFGHEGWSQDAEILSCTTETRTSQRRGEYTVHMAVARVKVTASFIEDGDVVTLHREDVGYGDGDYELAHKEAVTDAFKRACRTFGYPLGLALYDKEREHVGGENLSKKEGREVYTAFEKAMRMATSKEMLEEWGKDNAEAIKTLPNDWRSHIKDEYKRCMEALSK